MTEHDHDALWKEVRAQGQQIAALGARVDGVDLRLTTNEDAVRTFQEWKEGHIALSTEANARMTAELKELKSMLRSHLGSERRLWDKIWDVLQPLLITAILALLAAKGVK